MQGGGVRQQGGGLLSDPWLLAAASAGLVSAVMALWGLRGLPLGTAALWLSPMPLFLAGIGFGARTLAGAVGVAALALLVSGSTVALGVYVAAFGLPAVLLMAAAGRGGQGDLGLPLALLGILPAAAILGGAWWLSGAPGGLEGAMRGAAEAGLARLGLPADANVIASLVRVKAAAIGFWLALALTVCAAIAGGLAARFGLAAAPAWRDARLPAWYLALPGIALGVWAAAAEGADAVPLSLLLVLTVPVLLHGLAALHRRTAGLKGRIFLLAGLYGALVVFFVPLAAVVAGYGLYDTLTGNRGGRGAPPPRS